LSTADRQATDTSFRRLQAVLVAHVLLLLLEQNLPYAALVRGHYLSLGL
jgi:hypothetical protein